MEFPLAPTPLRHPAEAASRQIVELASIAHSGLHGSWLPVYILIVVARLVFRERWARRAPLARFGRIDEGMVAVRTRSLSEARSRARAASARGVSTLDRAPRLSPVGRG